MIEEMLKDFKNSPAGEDWSIVTLRYFNPVGAHPSGDIGEDPLGIPNNLMPYIAQVVVGRRDKLTVYGNDYTTEDGTGVRDYIHIVVSDYQTESTVLNGRIQDLADGHLSAIEYAKRQSTGYFTFNLGTGKGYSVLEMLRAMEKASGKPIPYVVGPRRGGDIAVCYADVTKAEREMGWKAHLTQEDMCRDLYNWQMKNPNGYRTAECCSEK
jgi:UDP-glucose 4-epimerase